jgi:hypothetical protein
MRKTLLDRLLDGPESPETGEPRDSRLCDLLVVSGAGAGGGGGGGGAAALLTAGFNQPAVGGTVNAAVSSSSGMQVDGLLAVATGGFYAVTAVPDAAHVTIRNLGQETNAAPGTAIALNSVVSVQAPDAFTPPSLPVQLFGPVFQANDAATFQAAMNFLTGKGIALFVPAGTYVIGTTLELKSDLTIWLSEGAVIQGNITSASPAAIFHYDGSSLQTSTTTVNANVTRWTNQVVVASVAGIAAGTWVGIFNHALGFRGGYYQVLAVNGGTKTLTLSRTIVWPFVVGDDVLIFGNGNPQLQNFSIEGLGAGATLTGHCMRYFYVYAHTNCTYKNLRAFGSGGQIASYGAFIFLEGYNNLFQKLYVDGTQGNSPSKSYAHVAEESSRIDNCQVVSDLTLQTGFEVYDMIDCTYSSCLASDTASGFILGSETVGTTVGPEDCTFTGCTAIGCASFGLNLGNGSWQVARCNFQGWSINNCGSRGIYAATAIACNFTGFELDGNSKGIELVSGSTRNKFSNFYFNGNGASAYDVQVDAGAKGNIFEGCELGPAGGGADHFLLNDDTTIMGLTGGGTTPQTAVQGRCINVQAGHALLSDVNLAIDGTNIQTIGLLTTNGGTVVDLDGFEFVLTNGAQAIQNGGGTTRLSHGTASGNQYGLVIASGTAIVYRDATSDFSGCTTPVNWTSGTDNIAKQTGTIVLVTGQKTLAAGISITAASVIGFGRKTQAGAVLTSVQYEAPSASRVVGGFGTGAFTVQASVAGGGVDVNDTSTLDWWIL